MLWRPLLLEAPINECRRELAHAMLGDVHHGMCVSPASPVVPEDSSGTAMPLVRAPRLGMLRRDTGKYTSTGTPATASLEESIIIIVASSPCKLQRAAPRPCDCNMDSRSKD